MGRLLLIDVAGAIVSIGIWYLAFARYNRRKGAAALRWVQVACRGRGKVVDSRWSGSSRLQARFQFPSRWFENARLTLNLRPRPLPVQWLMSFWRNQKETLTFEADLDCPPAFHLDVMHHRWSGHSNRKRSRSTAWEFTRPGPIVLTTRADWTQEMSPIVNALIASREQNFLKVRFRPDSPNFSATIDLAALNDPESAAGFFSVLRELAAGASARQL
ncbi:MAG TPA: hypothetical protein VFD30_06580 [Terriglobia bacterium]|nr:hypothetical protein [Terriglobia bacterium]